MVSTRSVDRANLYWAICHSLKLFILTLPGNWLNPGWVQARCTSLKCERLVLVRFVHCLIYKVHVPFVGTFWNYIRMFSLCQELFENFFRSFWLFRTAVALADSLVSIPPYAPVVNTFLQSFFSFFNSCQNVLLYLYFGLFSHLLPAALSGESEPFPFLFVR